MIIYQVHLFGVRLLTRAHGSAAYRAIIPSLFSTSILLIGVYGFGNPIDENDVDPIINDPYAIGVFVAFFTFLISFEAKFAYGRYWEGATAVHHMASKWLDVGMNIAAYHYQCKQYQKERPPAFGKFPKLRNMTRERERMQEQSMEELKASLEELEADVKTGGPIISFLRLRRRRRKRKDDGNLIIRSKSIASNWSQSKHREKSGRGKSFASNRNQPQRPSVTLPAPRRSHARGDTRPSQQFDNEFLDEIQTIPHLDGGVMETPSLFLQESAHLLSLLSAVAMSTLRTNVMDAIPPLVEHIPGRPWPPVDPDNLSSVIRKEYYEESRFWTFVSFLLGSTRSDRRIILYNEARPFRVLGGVSDVEMEQLCLARGPYAKVALCTKWLEEFISREHLAGSTGGVEPPIISRLYHFISEGMVGFNQCRKISYIPFPFPHAQLTILFIGVTIVVFPVLYYNYVNHLLFACILNFLTVMCFVGLHEVARELEQPFRNAPNDIPLTTFQAQFNEALIAMYAGFHPDSWWLPPMDNLPNVLEASGSDEEATDTKMVKDPKSTLKRPSKVTWEGRRDIRTDAVKEPYWKRVQSVSGNENEAADRVEEERTKVITEPNPILKNTAELTLEERSDEKTEELDPFLRMFKFVFGDEEEASNPVEEERPKIVKEPTSILKNPAESTSEERTTDKREAVEPYWIQSPPSGDDGKLQHCKTEE